MTTGTPELDGTSLSGVTVLVVDDEPVVREVVAEILALAGAKVLAAGDGATARAVAGEAAAVLDVILLDLALPDMAAEELLGHLGSIVPRAAIVAVTGAGTEAIARLMATGPVTSTLRKPFSLEDLVRTVEAALCGRSAGG